MGRIIGSRLSLDFHFRFCGLVASYLFPDSRLVSATGKNDPLGSFASFLCELGPCRAKQVGDRGDHEDQDVNRHADHDRELQRAAEVAIVQSLEDGDRDRNKNGQPQQAAPHPRPSHQSQNRTGRDSAEHNQSHNDGPKLRVEMNLLVRLDFLDGLTCSHGSGNKFETAFEIYFPILL